jgi:prevent-host-death family protein
VEVGIRALKDDLSRYIRHVEAGQRIAVTAHGRVVAELVPPGSAARMSRRGRWDELMVTMVTRDDRVRKNAEALGHTVE